MDRSRDTKSEDSVPDILTRDQMNKFDMFSEMNMQIRELTNLVLALTEKTSSSNREGNGL